jgi:hypothetical protein
MYDISTLVLTASKGLSIEKPVRVSLITHETRKMRKNMGLCETIYRKGKIQYHRVTVSLYNCAVNEYAVSDVILHELVHISMIEHDKFNPEYHHNKRFQKICKCLEDNLRDLGFKVGELYSPLSDTD